MSALFDEDFSIRFRVEMEMMPPEPVAFLILSWPKRQVGTINNITKAMTVTVPESKKWAKGF